MPLHPSLALSGDCNVDGAVSFSFWLCCFTWNHISSFCDIFTRLQPPGQRWRWTVQQPAKKNSYAAMEQCIQISKLLTLILDANNSWRHGTWELLPLGRRNGKKRLCKLTSFGRRFKWLLKSSIQPRHGRQSRSLPDAVQLLKNVRRASSAWSTSRTFAINNIHIWPRQPVPRSSIPVRPQLTLSAGIEAYCAFGPVLAAMWFVCKLTMHLETLAAKRTVFTKWPCGDAFSYSCASPF